MNASVAMRQAGRSKKMAEARLSFEERKTVLKWYLKCVYVFLAPSVYLCTSEHSVFFKHKRKRNDKKNHSFMLTSHSCQPLALYMSKVTT